MIQKLIIFTLVSCFLLSIQAASQSEDYKPLQHYPAEIFASSTTNNTSNSTLLNGDSGITMFSSAKNIAGIIIMMVVGGLASAGGGSGGALYIVILLIFFNYTENQCVQIVYGLVFAGAVGNIINVARNVETKTRRPLIDYDLALLIMPTMALGNNIGVILSRMAAPIVILVCLYLMLIYTLYRFILKLKGDLAKERKAKAVKAQKNLEIIDKPPARSPQGVKDGTPRGSFEHEAIAGGSLAVLVESIALEPIVQPPPKYVQFPLLKIAVLALLLFCTVFFVLLRGTNNEGSIVGVGFCSGGFWGVFVAGLLVCLVFAFFTHNCLISRNKIMKETVQEDMLSSTSKNNYPRLERAIMNKLAILGFLAGVLGGLLGIGGVMVINPTLLSRGFPTEIVAATSTFLIMQTSLMALIQSFLQRDIAIAEQLIFMALSFVGGFIVSFVLKKIIEKYQKPTLILMILVGLVIVSMIATPVAEIFDFRGQAYRITEFTAFCSNPT